MRAGSGLERGSRCGVDTCCCGWRTAGRSIRWRSTPWCGWSKAGCSRATVAVWTSSERASRSRPMATRRSSARHEMHRIVVLRTSSRGRRGGGSSRPSSYRVVDPPWRASERRWRFRATAARRSWGRPVRRGGRAPRTFSCPSHWVGRFRRDWRRPTGERTTTSVARWLSARTGTRRLSALPSTTWK